MKPHLLDVGALVLVLGSFATELLPLVQIFAASVGGIWYGIEIMDYFRRWWKESKK